MIKKATIANIIFAIAVCYIVSPWFFERAFLFNELLSVSGLCLLMYKRFRIGNDPISICITLLIGWGLLHAVVSLFRMDALYYYLRNMVIFYSMFAFFAGYYCLRFVPGFIQKIRKLLLIYSAVFLVIPVPRYIFERFGMSVLFPALIKKPDPRFALPILIIINIIYAVTYSSSTTMLLSMVYILLLFSPGYRFFKQTVIAGFIIFAAFFISIQPNLNIIKKNYNYYSDKAIHEVMDSHPVLGIDGNSTWRLVFWKEVIVDQFPANIFGIGFGTRMMEYFPVTDYSKLETLPYVFGAHNSYVYLFGRLGLIYVLLMIPVYVIIFKEYFYHKYYYYENRQILVFWSFFAITTIALFNPALESPIYAAGYWMILGFTAKCIHNRTKTTLNPNIPDEDPDHT